MNRPTVHIRVEVADALVRPSQLLVVKHAQYSYGVDAKVGATLGIALPDLPLPGAHLVVLPRGSIAAECVIFLGVSGLAQFDYRAIREFGRRAVSLPHRLGMEISEICVTLHGPGFGLDEAESFDSEVAGIVEAVSARETSPDLREVTFLERDPRRAERMDRLLTALLPDRRVEPAATDTDARGREKRDRLRTVGVDSGARSHAFVAMPFDENFDDHFYYGIAPSVRACGMLCERMDELAFVGDVVERLKDRIAKAKFVVADVTGANPNVYLEVGFAWGCGVPTVLVCRDASDLKFDIKGQRCITYTSIRDLETKLSREVAELFGSSADLRYR
ncbi:hypothetical protein [Actinoplanes sp. NPDC049681]|uniref:hypothetical protein n=1 Tax=Actinoplanes sp. NPDC049681 TaxID=3363905 RepID=UPI0037B30297